MSSQTMGTPMMDAPTPSTPTTNRTRAVLLTALALVVAAALLAWAKWLPYVERASGIAGSGHYPGKSLLTTGTGQPPLTRAWAFTRAYTTAVWRALVVALLISALVDALVPRRWLLRALGRRTPLGGSLAGGLAALPGMMCTCCTAPLAVTMRRAGVPTSAALAFWLGNPVLNPAVLVFLGLLAPWPWLVVRLGLGLVLVIGVSALLGWLAGRRPRVGVAAVQPETPAQRSLARAVSQEDAAPEPDLSPRQIPARFLRTLLRLAVILVPEYLAVVFLVGLVSEPLSHLLGHRGLVAVLVAAAVGTLLVLPTGGEVPILLGLAAAGAGAGVLGALILALPALSLPSAVMVGRALGWRVTGAAAVTTVVIAVAGGGLLTVLT